MARANGQHPSLGQEIPGLGGAAAAAGGLFGGGTHSEGGGGGYGGGGLQRLGVRTPEVVLPSWGVRVKRSRWHQVRMAEADVVVTPRAAAAAAANLSEQRQQQGSQDAGGITAAVNGAAAAAGVAGAPAAAAVAFGSPAADAAGLLDLEVADMSEQQQQQQSVRVLNCDEQLMGGQGPGEVTLPGGLGGPPQVTLPPPQQPPHAEVWGAAGGDPAGDLSDSCSQVRVVLGLRDRG